MLRCVASALMKRTPKFTECSAKCVHTALTCFGVGIDPIGRGGHMCVHSRSLTYSAKARWMFSLSVVFGRGVRNQVRTCSAAALRRSGIEGQLVMPWSIKDVRIASGKQLPLCAVSWKRHPTERSVGMR